MEGAVEHVEQRDDMRLQWVATVADKRAERAAKIVEQNPDQGSARTAKETRGTVGFEPRGDSKR